MIPWTGSWTSKPKMSLKYLAAKALQKRWLTKYHLGSGNTIPQFLGWNFREWGNSNYGAWCWWLSVGNGLTYLATAWARDRTCSFS